MLQLTEFDITILIKFNRGKFDDTEKNLKGQLKPIDKLDKWVRVIKDTVFWAW